MDKFYFGVGYLIVLAIACCIIAAYYYNLYCNNQDSLFCKFFYKKYPREITIFQMVSSMLLGYLGMKVVVLVYDQIPEWYQAEFKMSSFCVVYFMSYFLIYLFTKKVMKKYGMIRKKKWC